MHFVSWSAEVNAVEAIVEAAAAEDKGAAQKRAAALAAAQRSASHANSTGGQGLGLGLGHAPMWGSGIAGPGAGLGAGLSSFWGSDPNTSLDATLAAGSGSSVAHLRDLAQEGSASSSFLHLLLDEIGQSVEVIAFMRFICDALDGDSITADSEIGEWVWFIYIHCV